MKNKSDKKPNSHGRLKSSFDEDVVEGEISSSYSNIYWEGYEAWPDRKNPYDDNPEHDVWERGYKFRSQVQQNIGCSARRRVNNGLDVKVSFSDERDGREFADEVRKRYDVPKIGWNQRVVRGFGRSESGGYVDMNEMHNGNWGNW